MFLTRRRSVLGVHWKDWCWSWNSNTLATSYQELTHWKRPWCWERLVAGGEGNDKGWDGWMASPTRWTWVWVDSGSWWWTRRPGVLRFMGSQRVRNDWATEPNCHLMDCSMLGFPALHYLLEFVQTHVHWVDDATCLILCHPLLLPSIFPSIRVFLMSWFFASGGQNIRASALASVLPINIQGWFPLGMIGLISLLLKGLSRVFFSATFLKHQFFCAQPSLWAYISIIQTIWLEK